MSDRLSGIEANIAMLAALPEAARAELKQDMAMLASRVIELQRKIAPRHTGTLADALEIAQEIDRLRLRVGLTTIRRKSGRGGVATWYGIIVEYGRAAGEAIVTRRRPSAPKSRSRHANPGGFVTYTLHWTSLAPRPFIHVEAQVQSAIDALRERFWDAALHRAGAAA